MEMVGQGWPLYAAAVGTGRVFAVVGWRRFVDRDGQDAPPAAYGIEVDAEAEPTAVDLGTLGVKVIVTVGIGNARWLAGQPGDRASDGTQVEPWALQTPQGVQHGWIDDRNQEHFIPADSAVAGWRRLYVGPVAR